ncbi:hypothetical protein [Photorhabdus temperata]|nr:hypothetical protein [Photorhabdus temperata]
MGTRICREPDAVILQVRFCGGAYLGDRIGLLTLDPNMYDKP